MPACKEKRFVFKMGRFSVFKRTIIKMERNALFVCCLNGDNSKNIVGPLSCLLGVTHISTSVIIAMRFIIDIVYLSRLS